MVPKYHVTLQQVKNLLVVMENVFHVCGLVMGMMIVETIQTKIPISAQLIPVKNPNSAVEMAGVSSTHGNVIMKMIVVIEQMNKIVIILSVHLVNSPATIIDVFLKHKFVMG